MIINDSYADIHYCIKLGNLNIGFNGEFYTSPYFLTFLLERFLAERTEGISQVKIHQLLTVCFDIFHFICYNYVNVIT